MDLPEGRELQEKENLFTIYGTKLIQKYSEWFFLSLLKRDGSQRNHSSLTFKIVGSVDLSPYLNALPLRCFMAYDCDLESSVLGDLFFAIFNYARGSDESSMSRSNS